MTKTSVKEAVARQSYSVHDFRHSVRFLLALPSLVPFGIGTAFLVANFVFSFILIVAICALLLIALLSATLFGLFSIMAAVCSMCSVLLALFASILFTFGALTPLIAFWCFLVFRAQSDDAEEKNVQGISLKLLRQYILA